MAFSSAFEEKLPDRRHSVGENNVTLAEVDFFMLLITPTPSF